MRHIVSAFALAALVIGPGPLSAQTPVSPELGERLRAAVAERQAALGLAPDAEALAARLADGTPRDEASIDELVAPVALYPDALLAQVLVAATFPDQIARAGALIDEGDSLTDDELSAAIAAEDWDPSVLVLLSGFPTVVARMADDLDWTADLGGAMLHQDADVLAGVQRMRVKAEAAGNLQSNAAQVVDRTPEAIAIRPADPEKIYVPDYDPEAVYVSSRDPAPYAPSPYAATYVPTQTVQQPSTGFDAQTALISGAIGFGAGYLVNQMLDDDDGKDKDKNKGWKDYWKRNEAIDWRDRRFYPRPDRDGPRRPWQDERDRYWDRGDGRWRLDEAARRRDADERRDLMPWAAVSDRNQLSDREERRMRAWRDQARREAQLEAARERAAEERRAERIRDERQRRDRAEQEAERRAAAARQERREDQAAAERRAAEERRAAAARQERRAEQAAAERRAAVERRAEQDRAEKRAAAAREERAAARRAEAARAKAAEERRDKARADKQKPAAKPEPLREARPQPPRKQPPAEAKQRQTQPAKPKPQAAEAQRKQQPAKDRQQAAKKKCKPNDDRKECRRG